MYEAVAPQLRIGEPQPASDVEVGAALANLVANLGRTEEAHRRLQQLMATYPSNGDVEAALANLEAQTGQKQTALDHYRSTVAHNADGWRVHCSYARLLDDMGGELQPRLQALEEVLLCRSDLTEARLRLVRNLCTAGRFSDAPGAIAAGGNGRQEI